MRLKKSIYCVNDSYVIVSDYMSGKMEGMPAISTSCLCNPRCLKRLEEGVGICKACFAADGLAYKKGLRENCVQNYMVLNSGVLPVDELPIFKSDVKHVRFEAFGDVGSVTQCLNYINICNANPHVTFAMWTKNPDYWHEAIEDIGKPDNLICILSSQNLNEEISIGKYYWLDHTFTVYELEYLNNNNINHNDFINCGGRKCKTCLRCYDINNNDFSVKELLKADQKKIK